MLLLESILLLFALIFTIIYLGDLFESFLRIISGSDTNYDQWTRFVAIIFWCAFYYVHCLNAT